MLEWGKHSSLAYWIALAVVIVIVALVVYHNSHPMCAGYSGFARAVCDNTYTACAGKVSCQSAVGSCMAGWGAVANAPDSASRESAVNAHAKEISACSLAAVNFTPAAKTSFDNAIAPLIANLAI